MNFQTTLTQRDAHLFVLSLTDGDAPLDNTLSERTDQVDLNYEIAAEIWQPDPPGALDHLRSPRIFVDGKTLIRPAAGGRDPDGVPLPILAAQIGAGWFDRDGKGGGARARRQGTLLFSAQQQTADVASEIIQNRDRKILGRTGSVELASSTWSRLFTTAEKQRATKLNADERMILQGLFFGWMNLIAPYPACAMKREHIAIPAEPPYIWRAD